MATVKVGLSQEVFVIHKELLCHHSTYFKAALEGSFIEAEQGVVYLCKADVKTFTLFESWLYRQRVPAFEDSEVYRAELWDELVDLYIFADAHGIAQLGNQVVEALIDLATESTRTPGVSTVAMAWSRLPPTSPMRELLASFYAWDGDGEDLVAEELHGLPSEFLSSVMLICMKRLPFRLKGEEAPFEKDRCQFHVHSSQDEAKNCSENRKSPPAKPGRKPKKQTVTP